MDQFYLHQSRILEDEMSKTRSLINEVSLMGEMCSDLLLSLAALQNPELMIMCWEAEVVLKEIKAKVEAILGKQDIQTNMIKDQSEESRNSDIADASEAPIKNGSDLQQESEIEK